MLWQTLELGCCPGHVVLGNATGASLDGAMFVGIRNEMGVRREAGLGGHFALVGQKCFRSQLGGRCSSEERRREVLTWRLF